MATRPLLGTNTTLSVPGLGTATNGSRIVSEELSKAQATVNSETLSLDVAVSQGAVESKTVDVYLNGSNVSGSYGTVVANSNMRLVGSVDLSEATPKKNMLVGSLPPFFTFVFVQNGAQPLTAETVTFTSMTFQDV